MSRWLPRWLFRLTVLAATLLVLAVLLAPWLDRGGNAGPGRVLGLFARDVLVRRTSLAAAIGLYVTAGVFFRSTANSRPGRRTRQPPPPNVIGA